MRAMRETEREEREAAKTRGEAWVDMYNYT